MNNVFCLKFVRKGLEIELIIAIKLFLVCLFNFKKLTVYVDCLKKRGIEQFKSFNYFVVVIGMGFNDVLNHPISMML